MNREEYEAHATEKPGLQPQVLTRPYFFQEQNYAVILIVRKHSDYPVMNRWGGNCHARVEVLRKILNKSCQTDMIPNN